MHLRYLAQHINHTRNLTSGMSIPFILKIHAMWIDSHKVRPRLGLCQRLCSLIKLLSIWAGGAISCLDTFVLSGGDILIEDCLSSSMATDSIGGAIYAGGMLIKSPANLKIQRCVASGKFNVDGGHGGAVFCESRFNQTGGEIEIRDCAAHVLRGQTFSSGGGITSRGHFDQFGGSITVVNCTAAMDHGGSGKGGAIYAEKELRISGKMYISGSTARGSENGQGKGGAMCSNAKIVVQPKANLTIERCTAKGGKWCGGGAAHAHTMFQQSGGSVNIRSCTVHSSRKESFGGGVSCEQASQIGGGITVQTCSAQAGGGGLYAAISAHQTAGARARFEGCQSSQHGGAAYSAGDTRLHGDTVFSKSWAEFGNGGGLYVDGSLNASALAFHDCHAGISGGGLFARGLSTVQSMSFTRCSSLASTVLVQQGNLTVGEVEITGLVDDSLGQHMVVNGKATGTFLYMHGLWFLHSIRSCPQRTHSSELQSFMCDTVTILHHKHIRTCVICLYAHAHMWSTCVCSFSVCPVYKEECKLSAKASLGSLTCDNQWECTLQASANFQNSIRQLFCPAGPWA